MSNNLKNAGKFVAKAAATAAIGFFTAAILTKTGAADKVMDMFKKK